MWLPAAPREASEKTGVSSPWVSPSLSNAGEETTRKGTRGEDKVERNSSSKTGMWDGKDGLQLAWLGGWGLRKKELALNGEWKSKAGWVKPWNKNTGVNLKRKRAAVPGQAKRLGVSWGQQNGGAG